VATASPNSDDVLLKIEFYFVYFSARVQCKNTRFKHQKKKMCKITSELANPERENDAPERARLDEVNESDYARASNNLLSARKAFDETVARMKATKGQLKKRREDEEKKREADFATEATRLMNALREMQIGGDDDGDVEFSMTKEERREEFAVKERRARVARKEAAKQLEEAISAYDREIGRAQEERRAKIIEEEAIDQTLRDVEKELYEVKFENDREEGEEQERNDAIANGLNRARAARVIQKAFRLKKNRKKKSKKKKKGATTTTKSGKKK
jgi:hypothetical protein